jgi:hypothetical protein
MVVGHLNPGLFNPKFQPRNSQLQTTRGLNTAIISRGLYIFYPISKDHFFVFKEFFSENSVLMYGLYSRAASNQEQLMMARVGMVEKSGVYKFRVEMSCKILELGHFKPRRPNPRLFNHELFNPIGVRG